MPKNSTTLREYLALLGVTSREEQTNKVTDLIRSALRQRNRFVAPIRLSDVVSEFAITPRPIFDENIKEGRLEYCDASGMFTIRLNPGYNPDPPKKHPHQEIAFNNSLSRMRFTYAHEVAHRFFYIPTSTGWTRALQAFPKRRTGSSTIRALLNLREQEERMCNDIAVKILVPLELLRNPMENYISQSDQALKEGFANQLGLLADAFLVSLRCMLLRLAKARQKGDLKLPDTFAVTLIDEQVVNGKGQFSIFLFMGPPAWDYFFRPIFYNMPIEKLGPEWEYFCRSIPNVPKFGSMELETTLVRNDGIVTRSKMRGWWTNWKSQSGNNARQILVWGNLDPMVDLKTAPTTANAAFRSESSWNGMSQ